MPHPLIALVLDTALGACSVAVGDEKAVLAARYEERAAGQAERLVPMIDEVLREAALSAEAVARIGVTIGPGSFTGTRIGLATARAMGLALGVPVLGITTLEAIALGVPEAGPVVTAFDARRSQIYAQLLDGATPLTAPLALSLEEAAARLPDPPAPAVLIGSAAAALAPHLTARGFPILRVDPAPFPAASAFLSAIARRPLESGAMPRPLYLRPADAAPAGRAAS